ncbi:hypothetical protein QR78_06260 [Methylobacterium indicum]|uniref:Uncharacterized protein n=1 Tax=Methylobacterium indicum TaxID=1775910 RepID=A0ABR5HIN0_9HYPH|nr:hypothetical protein QR78_06260 [Methylobacterium indicum]KMO26530.1 hypothetical protein QR79_01805 [Methylobacterium indicum]
MTDPLTFEMSLDLDILEPGRVLEAGAREYVRRHSAPTIDEARAHLAGDMAKALAVLVDLRDLTADGAVVVRIETTATDPELPRLPGPPPAPCRPRIRLPDRASRPRAHPRARGGPFPVQAPRVGRGVPPRLRRRGETWAST